MKYVITIDGTASSGKNTIGELLAKKLHFIFIDTGYIYRAFTVAFLSLYPHMPKEAIADFATTAEFQDIYIAKLKTMDMSFKAIDDEQHLFIDGVDHTHLLHTVEASTYVPAVSAIKAVREVAHVIQYEIADKFNVVMAGRDIGTVIFPHAKMKFYLTAAMHVRAKRRMKQLKNTGKIAKDVTIDTIIMQLEQRDKEDIEREIAPLKIPEGAYIIDNSYATVEESVDKMMIYIKKNLPEALKNLPA